LLSEIEVFYSKHPPRLLEYVRKPSSAVEYAIMLCVATSNQPASFSDATALCKITDGVYAGTLGSEWWVGAGPNGGYLAALFVKALTQTLSDPTRALRSLTIHYLRRPSAEPFEICCSIERGGRSLSSVSARMYQHQQPVALALAAFSRSWSGIEFDTHAMPDVADPTRLSPWNADDQNAPFARQFDYRWLPNGGLASDAQEVAVGGWIRLADPQPLDSSQAVLLLDAWPPSITARAQTHGGAPTIDFTVHLRCDLSQVNTDPQDYYLAIFRSRLASQGFFEEDGSLWTRSGDLIAQSRQLALAVV
jgi:acyl-CoA thioesterase